jgi:hypothetical protein
LKVKQLVLINLSHKIVNRKKFVGEEHQQRRKNTNKGGRRKDQQSIVEEFLGAHENDDVTEDLLINLIIQLKS